MVSFQCHACGDVVKKPKLDQHRSRCHTGFDCIDCSKTFKTPGEYKGHTSCISEAEKYQKSLYKGPKTGPNGQKSINSTHQSNSLPEKTADAPDISACRQSNAQWNRTSQPSSFDNVNGYSDDQYQQLQNGWQSGRGSHRYGDRGRKPSGWQQNRFPRSNASGANDTPLGISRRSSIDDQTGVTTNVPTSEATNRDEVSQENSPAEETETKGKPPNDKRIRKVAANTDNSSSQTGKEKSTKSGSARDISAVVNNDVKNDDEERKAKKRKKKEANGEATGVAEAGYSSEVKEKTKRVKKRRENQPDDEQGSADGDGAGSGDKKNTKEEKKRKRGIDESSSVGAGEAGSEDKKRKKEKKRKERNVDNDDEAGTTVAEDIKILASVDEQPTKTKKRKKRATTDIIVVDSETPLETAATEDTLMSAPVHEQTAEKKKRVTTHTTSVDKEEKRRKKEKRRGEKVLVLGEH